LRGFFPLSKFTSTAQKRMTIEDYQRNLRGVNDGKDFSNEYLASLLFQVDACWNH
jgi:brefeldin A-resistance guanine nucleotide exchange factor 1